MQKEHLSEPEQQKEEKSKTVITNKFSFPNYFKFLVLNFIIAVIPIILVFNWVSTKEEAFLIALFAAGVAMMLFMLQYPLLVFVKPWAFKFGLLYLSMCLFFFIFGLISSLYERADGFSLDKIMLHLYDGVIWILVGHIFGIIFFPIVALLNWLLRKQMFVYQDQK